MRKKTDDFAARNKNNPGANGDRGLSQWEGDPNGSTRAQGRRFGVLQH
jgi:hypothetical protein